MRSDEMLEIMKTRGIGYGSYFPRAVLGKNGDKNVVRRATHSKVGYWSPTENSSDAAIIESAGHDGTGTWRPVRYIAVLLNDVGQNRFDPLMDIMDAYVKEANGLK